MSAPPVDPRPGAGAPPAGVLLRVVRLLATAYTGAVLVLLLGATLPRLLGWVPHVVLSGSMQPALHPGDVVITAPIGRPEDLTAGDVVEASSPARSTGTYVHRLTRTTGDGRWLTRGDANAQDDYPAVASADITGRVRLVVPYVGTPYLHLRDGNPLPTILAGLPPLLDLDSRRRRRRGRGTVAAR